MTSLLRSRAQRRAKKGNLQELQGSKVDENEDERVDRGNEDVSSNAAQHPRTGRNYRA